MAKRKQQPAPQFVKTGHSIELAPLIFVAAHVCSVCGEYQLGLIVGEVTVCYNCFSAAVNTWAIDLIREMTGSESEE